MRPKRSTALSTAIALDSVAISTAVTAMPTVTATSCVRMPHGRRSVIQARRRGGSPPRGLSRCSAPWPGRARSCAQVLDVCVDRPLVAGEVMALHAVHELVARVDPARVLRQRQQQLELALREVLRRPVHLDLVAD